MSELLHTVRRGTGAEPDLAFIEQRARSLRRQERVRFGALAATALILVPVVYRGTTAEPDEIRPAPSVDAPSMTPTPRAATPSFTAPQPSGASATAAPGESAAASANPSDTPDEGEAGPTSPSASAARAGFPPAASCRVDTAGLAREAKRTCRFTATGAGGWVLNGRSYPTISRGESGEVLVERDGHTTRYGVTLNTCRDGVIRPGDFVTVTITGQVDPMAVENLMELAAGVGEGCASRG